MRARLIAFLHVLSQPVVAIGGAVVIGALIIGGTFYLTSVSPSGAYTAAVVAPITQEVDVSGTVQGAETTDLSFQISGQVASIPAKVGEQVGAGQVLVSLAGGSQAASQLGAQANLEAAQANLASLEAGTRPEQLAIDQNAVTQDQTALANAIQSAYVAADTAVHTDADQFFSNARTASAALTVTVPDSTLATQLVNERIALEPLLTAWGADISGTSPATAVADLTQVATFLNDAASALSKVQVSSATSAATLAGYQAAISAARQSVSGSLTVLTSAQTALTGAQGTLTLAQAGSTPQAIAAAQAQVDAASAALSGAKVSSGETVLTAPINGTITAQNAHLGESVSPGMVLVSMQSTGSFEVKAPVSESDIAKVKVGQEVDATFDAYPGVTFPATVTAVDPAATITNGVSSYQVTATFTNNDPRIQSGMTAHLAIITATVPSALTIPLSAVISDNGEEFVYVKGTGSSPDTRTQITTGVESDAGMVEVLSGLSAGQQVLTFGNAQ